MSTQSIEWLQNNVMVDVSRHGKPWHADRTPGVENPNLYDGPIPLADVVTRLFPWEPIGLPLTVVFKGETVTLNDYKAWVRDDTGQVMGIHSENYLGHSYKKNLIDRVAEIVESNENDLSIATAGLLDDGAKAWVEITVPDTITTPEGVEFLPLLLATTSLDGSIATTYKRTVTLVVCDNTRAAALSGRGAEYKVKHTKNSEMKLLEARAALDLVMATAGEFEAQVAELTSKKVTPKQWNKFLSIVNPIPEEDYAKREGTGELIVLNQKAITRATNKRDEYIAMYNSDERVAPWKGTAFGVLQCVNTFEHHASKANKDTVRLERNMLRTLKGEYDKLDQDTYKILETVLA